jgi:hypothetical protein
MQLIESGNDADTATATAKGFVNCNSDPDTLPLPSLRRSAAICGFSSSGRRRLLAIRITESVH